jgi:uncharacterized protein (TIGR00251 family)
LKHSSSSQNNKYPFLESTDRGLFLNVKVSPRASKGGLALSDTKDKLKVRLTKAPVDGAANKALISILSKTLKIPKSSITITSGLKSRNKRVKVEGMDVEEIEDVLTSL